MKHLISLLFGLFIGLFPLLAQQDINPKNLLLILDGSGSMWGKMDGAFKIAIARQSINQLAAGLPPEARLGLIAYGHRRKGDCSDIELLLPPGPLNPEQLSAAVEGVTPTGKTPITASLQEAFTLIRKSGEPTAVLLISDGLETCDADPCEAARLAKAEGLPFVLHVIGFGVEDESVAQLECIAQAGDGLYFDARDSGALSGALQQAAETPVDTAGGYFWVKGLDNDGLADLAVNIYDKEGKGIAGGRTYQSPETNPRLFRLPKGDYQVEVEAVRMRGQSRQLLDITIGEGDTIRHLADFSTGELAILVTRNGELSDASVNIFLPDGERATAGRTYRSDRSNPKVFTLTAGTYRLVIGSVEIKGAEEVEMHNIEVKGQARTDISHEFESGTLRVGARNASGLVDALVYIRREGERATVAQGRTYTSEKSNPKTFELATGKYTVEVKQVKGEGKTSFKVEVGKGITQEKMVEW